jgi:hypothetical protein
MLIIQSRNPRAKTMSSFSLICVNAATTEKNLDLFFKIKAEIGQIAGSITYQKLV